MENQETTRKNFPRIYRFNAFIRWFTLIFAVAAIVYSVWLIFNRIEAESSKFVKIVPFIIIFFASNSLMRNLFSLNTIVFKEDAIIFRFLARKSVRIPWNSIRKMELEDARHKMIKISYEDENGQKGIFRFTLSFPNMLEIINGIAEMCPQAEYDEFLKNVIIVKDEKSEVKLQKVQLPGKDEDKDNGNKE
ncbi:MAG: hypothetical protein B6D62_03080 [Candidatus Cloacimonas sp. 4484_275]|nr:MAG: hypothetical protein B6D62_03080 [Candidatus Cloacimonas sp. 4484_275]